ncbi:MAG: glycosyltransferase family A protein [Candidatus Deferrimicrobiaceae bacterium]
MTITIREGSAAGAPLVSVVMPSYNRESLIESSIRSVLEQTAGNLELLLVDDGSTDETAAVIRRMAEADTRIHMFLLGKNSGDPAVPRNVALRSAKGKYVAFLDSDDLWLPQKLDFQVSFLEMNPRFGAVHANATAFRADGSGKEWPMHSFRPHADGDIFERMVRADAIVLATLLMRRSCLDTVGFFREGIPVGEDYEFKLRLAKEYEVAYQSRVLARYCYHGTNISADEIEARLNDYRLIKELSNHLEIPGNLRRETLSTIKYYLARARFLRGDNGFREDVRESVDLDGGNVRARVLRLLSPFPPFVFRAIESVCLGIWRQYKKIACGR